MLDNGDTFTHDGLTFRLQIIPDHDHGAPWDEEDGHGPVSDWTTRDKRPGEMVLCEDGRGRAKRFYDFAAAMRQAKAEGWNHAPYTGTRGERAVRAVFADFKRLQDWCEDRWQWCGVVVTCEDLPEEPKASLWGIESDAGDYFEEVARDLADELISAYAAEVRKAVA